MQTSIMQYRMTIKEHYANRWNFKWGKIPYNKPLQNPIVIEDGASAQGQAERVRGS